MKIRPTPTVMIYLAIILANDLLSAILIQKRSKRETKRRTFMKFLLARFRERLVALSLAFVFANYWAISES